jgi:hypothetical protein
MMIAGLSQAAAVKPIDVNRKVVTAFYSVFNQAKNVSWRESANFVVAEFSLNNQVMYAYYKRDGSFIGIIRHLLTTDLPYNLKKSLRKNYSDYWVTDLFKLETGQGTAYYVNLENGTETVLLNTNEYNVWTTYKITRDSEKGTASF